MFFLKKRGLFDIPKKGYRAYAAGDVPDIYHVPIAVYWVLSKWRDVRIAYLRWRALR